MKIKCFKIFAYISLCTTAFYEANSQPFNDILEGDYNKLLHVLFQSSFKIEPLNNDLEYQKAKEIFKNNDLNITLNYKINKVEEDAEEKSKDKKIKIRSNRFYKSEPIIEESEKVKLEI